VKIIVLSLLVILIAGCAAKPSAIQPAMVSTAEYVNMSCQNLDTRITSEISNLETLTGEQIAQRNWDIALNIILLPGLGAATGDSEVQIAQAKGRLIAMQDEYGQRCTD
jgi:hypothetical protein|tara:strand:- start:296 stop:622 length:327 start_codon:yes stop_codon:yes gene_type:complete